MASSCEVGLYIFFAALASANMSIGTKQDFNHNAMAFPLFIKCTSSALEIEAEFARHLQLWRCLKRFSASPSLAIIPPFDTILLFLLAPADSNTIVLALNQTRRALPCGLAIYHDIPQYTNIRPNAGNDKQPLLSLLFSVGGRP